MSKQGASPERIVLTQEEAQSLRARVSTCQSLSPEDIKIVTGLIDFSLWLQNQLSLAKLTIRRLKSFFGFKTEKKSLRQSNQVKQTDH